jgi:hypothetical protein
VDGVSVIGSSCVVWCATCTATIFANLNRKAPYYSQPLYIFWADCTFVLLNWCTADGKMCALVSDLVMLYLNLAHVISVFSLPLAISDPATDYNIQPTVISASVTSVFSLIISDLTISEFISWTMNLRK